MSQVLRTRLAIGALLAASLIVLTGFGCRPRQQGTNVPNSSITLSVWGLWQESAHLEPIIDSFKEQTGIEVEYKKMASVAEYEKTLLRALAEGRGPDVFVVHHTWIDDKKSLMSPAPSNIIDERALLEEFVDVVADDVIRGSEIYALPTSIDTLALYYNKDLLNSAGVARPPQTWQEFQLAVERLTKITSLGSIEQSGAALGTAANITRAADILQLLMLQSGVSIIDRQLAKASLATEAAERSLTFYTDFANKGKKVYTWDLRQDHALDAFAAGKTAMIINYAYNLPTVQAKNPRLRFAVASMPQIADGQEINFASYWPFAVSRQSAAPVAAWQFVRHLASAESAQTLNKTENTPPARRDAVTTLSRDPELGVFAEQILTAVSWPRTDIVAIDALFTTMIDSVVTGAATTSAALGRAEGQLNLLLPEPEQVPQQPDGDGLKGPGQDIGIF